MGQYISQPEQCRVVVCSACPGVVGMAPRAIFIETNLAMVVNGMFPPQLFVLDLAGFQSPYGSCTILALMIWLSQERMSSGSYLEDTNCGSLFHLVNRGKEPLVGRWLQEACQQLHGAQTCLASLLMGTLHIRDLIQSMEGNAE